MKRCTQVPEQIEYELKELVEVRQFTGYDELLTSTSEHWTVALTVNGLRTNLKICQQKNTTCLQLRSYVGRKAICLWHVMGSANVAKLTLSSTRCIILVLLLYSLHGVIKLIQIVWRRPVVLISTSVGVEARLHRPRNIVRLLSRIKFLSIRVRSVSHHLTVSFGRSIRVAVVGPACRGLPRVVLHRIRVAVRHLYRGVDDPRRFSLSNLRGEQGWRFFWKWKKSLFDKFYVLLRDLLQVVYRL